MTRILVLTPDFPPAPGGIQLLIGRLVAELAQPAEVQVVTLSFEGAAAPAPGRVRVVTAGRQGLSGNKVSNARLNAASLWVGVRFRPDVVISGHAVCAPGAVAVRALTRARVIQYLHADEARQRPRLLSFAVRRADAVVAVSSHARALALAAGADPERVRVINPGVDPPAGPPVRRSEQPTLVTVARLQVAYKGHDKLIEALPAIRERVPDLRWVVLGDGELRPRLERLAAGAGIAEAVRFEGHVSDEQRDRWLDSAHVFAMPSRLPDDGTGGEGFGIVYLEAGSHGLPVVAGAVGGAVDAVVDQQTGLLVDPTDATEIADAISRLLLDRELAARLGQAGAARAKRFSWKRHVDQVRELIEEVRRR